VLTPTYAATATALLLRRPWALPLVALGLASGVRSVRAALPPTPQRNTLATHLAVRGLLWAARQESALLLRHWWPAAAAGALASSTIRRSLVSALIVDTIASATERRNHPRPGIATTIAGRRLDDLAYGAGLWWGALRGRSPRVLLPRRPGSARSATSRIGTSASTSPASTEHGTSRRGAASSWRPRHLRDVRDVRVRAPRWRLMPWSAVLCVGWDSRRARTR
jgi:hypothetical protein